MKEETPGQCSSCGAKIKEGHIGLCKACFKKKYHQQPTSKGRNY